MCVCWTIFSGGWILVGVLVAGRCVCVRACVCVCDPAARRSVPVRSSGHCWFWSALEICWKKEKYKNVTRLSPRRRRHNALSSKTKRYWIHDESSGCGDRTRRFLWRQTWLFTPRCRDVFQPCLLKRQLRCVANHKTFLHLVLFCHYRFSPFSFLVRTGELKSNLLRVLGCGSNLKSPWPPSANMQKLLASPL